MPLREMAAMGLVGLVLGLMVLSAYAKEFIPVEEVMPQVRVQSSVSYSARDFDNLGNKYQYAGDAPRGYRGGRRYRAGGHDDYSPVHKPAYKKPRYEDQPYGDYNHGGSNGYGPYHRDYKNGGYDSYNDGNDDYYNNYGGHDGREDRRNNGGDGSYPGGQDEFELWDERYGDNGYGDNGYGDNNYGNDGYGDGPDRAPYGGEGAGSFGLPEFENRACITDIDEYAAAFNRGGVNRCVDPDIIVRLERYFLNVTVTTKQKIWDNFLSGRNKSVTFWSYSDNPEKYIRIGRSALTLGNFVDNPNTPPNAGYQAGSFPGIRDKMNFVALLEQIGYASTSTDPKRGYMMVITKRPKINKTPVFIPTWSNVAKYFEWYVRVLASADEAALKAANITHPEICKKFKIDAETIDILNKKTFANLTGCQAQCTFMDTYFGNEGDTTWSSPTKSASRLSDTACDTSKNPSPRYELTEPSIIEDKDNFCTDPDYIKYRAIFTYNSAGDETCLFAAANTTENRALALLMAKEYLAATPGRQRAIVFRTYLLRSCTGTFNPLFSGDGFTYTANGGFLGATGHELLTGETLPEDLPEVFPKIRVVFFCPYSNAGYPYEHAICPDSTGVFTPPAGWDVREVQYKP